MTTYPQEDDENYETYTTLSQIDCCIRWSYTKDRRHLEKLIKKTKSIDYQIPAKGKFVSHTNEKLIGKTALHLACDYYWHENDIGKCESIKLLLKYNADTTIKDALGLTALLGLVEHGSKSKNWLREGAFACGCISSLLSAQVASNKHENPSNKYGLSHFHVACMGNHSKAVQFFLKHGVDVNQTVSIDSPVLPGHNPLHFAVSSCALQTAEILLENGGDPLQKNANGLTSVHQLLECSIILFNKIDIHRESDEPASEVLLADIHKNQEIMELFLKIERVRKLNILDEFGLSVLHLACILKSESLIDQLLMDDVVDIDRAIDVNSPVCPGVTPLHFAAMFNLDIVMILLKKEADPTIKNADGRSPLDFCLKKYSANDIRGILSTQSVWKDIVMSDGKTKLLDLVHSMQDLNFFESFVNELQAREQKEMFVPSDSPLWPGYTPLHIAVTLAERADVEFCKRQCNSVKDQQTEIEVDLNIVEKCLLWHSKASIAQDAQGSTPIHLAFCSKKICVLELLLLHCIQENPVNEDNLSHFHIACAVGHVAAIESLPTNADVNAPVGSNYAWFMNDTSVTDEGLKTFQIKSGYTALHIALAAGNDSITKLLLKRGADINFTDDNGITPIHLLLNQNLDHLSHEVTEILWSHPDLKDVIVRDTGLSHLHVAVNQEDVEAVERLLKLGANPNAAISNQLTDSHPLYWRAGCTPLHFLKISDTRSKILDLLLQYGADFLAMTRNESSILSKIFDTIEDTRVFVSYLKENEVEQSRIRESTGLTMLHLACYILDLESVKTILENDKTDVNAQVHQDSRFWPGCTPLHVLMLSTEVCEGEQGADLMEKVVSTCKLLLKNGANVTFWSNHYGTPMHAAMAHSYSSKEVLLVLSICVSSMLNKYADFNENPVDRNGISLFHVACRMNVVRAAERLLEDGVDVNEPIDKFLCCPNASEYAGYTPLHLCLTHQCSLRMINLLLKYGANIHTENYNGDTPLHIAAFRCTRRGKIFERLIVAGADVNAENVYSETSLEVALRARKATSREVKFLCERGYKPNYFNNITQIGYLSYVYEDETNWSLANAMFNATGFYEPDEMGRTGLHNIVACTESSLTYDEYVILIEKVTKLGCAVNFQNKSGQTALHYAAFFSNAHAVSALLLAGADINSTDDNADTPYSCALNPYTATYDANYYSSSNCKFVIKILANHVQQLEFLNLHVNKINSKIQQELTEHGHLGNSCLKDYFEIDLNDMLEPYSGYAEDLNTILIGNSSLTFSDFLIETGLVFAYPTMALEDREAINKFFEDRRLSYLEDTFGEHAKFLNLQYQKALARKSLLEQAAVSLVTVTRFLLPEICAHAIVNLLNNDDLKNIIASANALYA